MGNRVSHRRPSRLRALGRKGSLFPELERDSDAIFTTGLLPDGEVRAMIEQGAIQAILPIEPGQLQPASLDLRLGPVAYEVRASFLPTSSGRVLNRVRGLLKQELDLSTPRVLTRGSVYIIPLQETLRLPENVLGKANPKSTTGRLDVFTRLIVDYADAFEVVPRGYQGALYVEVAPHTFDVLVHAGTRLNQLRLIRGNPAPSDRGLTDLHRDETLVYNGEGVPLEAVISRGLWLSVDLDGVGLERVGAETILGYRAKRSSEPIDLDRIGYYDPEQFWEPIPRPADGELILDPGEFYILASREQVRVPPTHAAEMVAYDPSVGEFRLHYAGFFDPGFGCGGDDLRGTRAVLEVRSHEVPFLLRHGQRVGRLIYERLRSAPERLYGGAIGSSYQAQGVSLSKQFRRSSVASTPVPTK